MKASLQAAAEINAAWLERINRLNHGTADRVNGLTDTEVAAIIERHCNLPEQAK